MRKRKKKLYFRSVRTRPGIENSKKIAKQFKKLKNTIMASFQAKTSWESPRRGKNEKKLKNILMSSFQAKTGLARLRKRKKNYRSDRCKTDQE